MQIGHESNLAVATTIIYFSFTTILNLYLINLVAKYGCTQLDCLA